MAPRKRTTKQPKADPRAAKLQAFIDDFDSEVETRLSQMREKIDKLLVDVDNSYDMALMKQPRAVRQMPWMEFYKLHQPKAAEERRPVEAPQDLKSGEEAAILESEVARDHTALLKSLKKATRKKGAAKSSSDDENVPASSRRGPAARRPPSTAKRTKVLSVTKQHAAIRCSSRKPLVTPARNMMDSSLVMGQTPLVTPRFDPRLPKTPAVRVPRHKERVYSISANGSPITAGSQDIVLNFPVGNGESIQLLASEMDSLDLNLLDETALRSIRQLKDRLTTLCGTSE
ncbi:borealin [Fundulus heteroclitus]|uniref:borealin n=1 Tax=Fundulus heteroclitus TaxID=8078 RepID=UPI00165CE943|nr:borealin [Fundulus heteroclitus]